MAKKEGFFFILPSPLHEGSLHLLFQGKGPGLKDPPWRNWSPEGYEPFILSQEFVSFQNQLDS